MAFLPSASKGVPGRLPTICTARRSCTTELEASSRTGSSPGAGNQLRHSQNCRRSLERRYRPRPLACLVRNSSLAAGGFRREVQPRRQHWFLNEKSGFPFRTPAFCSASRGRRRLGEKEYRAASVTPGVALRPRTQGGQSCLKVVRVEGGEYIDLSCIERLLAALPRLLVDTS